MQLYFNSMATGGSGDGDLGQSINFWTDAGWTIPGGNPTSSDNVQLDDAVLVITGPGVSLNNLTTSGPALNFSGGPGLVVYGIVTGITFTSTTQMQGASTILNCVGCTFNSDPFAAATTNTISGTSGCAYNIAFGEKIIDVGGTFNAAVTFTNNVTATSSTVNSTFAGPLTILNSCTLSTTVFAGASTLNGCNVTGGSSSNTVTQIFNGCAVSGGSWNQNVDFIGAINVTAGSFGTAGTCTMGVNGAVSSIDISGATFGIYTTFTIAFANKIKVLIGSKNNIVNGTNGQSGTLLIPAPNKVQLGQMYGPNATTTGTLSGGSSVVGYFG